MNPLRLITAALKALASLLSGLAFWRWGAERERRKAAEGTVDTLKQREEIRREVETQDDQELVDRLTRR